MYYAIHTVKSEGFNLMSYVRRTESSFFMVSYFANSTIHVSDFNAVQRYLISNMLGSLKFSIPHGPHN